MVGEALVACRGSIPVLMAQGKEVDLGRIVIRARRAATVPRSLALLLALGLPLAYMLVTEGILNALGLPPGTRPLPLRLADIAPVLAIWVVALLAMAIGPRRGFGFLYDKVEPRAVVDKTAISVRLGDGSERRFAHEAVGSLDRRSGGLALQDVYELRDALGAVIARIPEGLAITGQDEEMGGFVTLAEAVVMLRPDRYVVVPGAMGLTPTFRLRRADEPPSDLLALAEPKSVFVLALGGVLAIAALALIVLLFAR
jgi:hypothetical protein